VVNMGKRVLVVDDSPFMRMLVKNILAPKGFEIAGEAGNGKEAVEAYESLKPDVVTMDLVMPELDGISALREIRRMDAQARIIMVTGAEQHSTVMQAMNEGAAGYVVKPFQAEKVLAAMDDALNGEA
jgi:two-component system, chemotaxis family, chemotaxis protein CheY